MKQLRTSFEKRFEESVIGTFKKIASINFVDAFLGGMIGVFIMVIIQVGTNAKGQYYKTTLQPMITECEKTLRRDQHCELIATQIEKDTK